MPENRHIFTETAEKGSFAPFGDLLATEGSPDMIINQGKCGRWHDLAQLDVSDGRAGISLFLAEKLGFPYQLDLLEDSKLNLPMSYLLCFQKRKVLQFII